MTAFLVRRLAFACVTLFAVLTLVFVLVRIVPGDPAQLILGDQASREAIEALRQRLGLDLPICEQYVVFLAGALRGDWGVSMVTGQPVIGEVLRVLPWTIELTVVSLLLGIVARRSCRRLRGDPSQPLRRLRSAHLLAARAVVPAVRLGHHPAARLRDRAAVVPGDQRALGQPRRPGTSRSRCRPSASA